MAKMHFTVAGDKPVKSSTEAVSPEQVTLYIGECADLIEKQRSAKLEDKLWKHQLALYAMGATCLGLLIKLFL